MSVAETHPLDQEIKVVNIGLELFAAALRQQDVEVVQVDWRPPADGDPELLDILDQLL
jgi:FdrA protein